MDDLIKIDAVSLGMLSGETVLDLGEYVNSLGLNFKANVLWQILEQAERQFYDTLAEMFIEASSLENRQNLLLKNRVRKFAKKYKETTSLTIPNISRLEIACQEKLQIKTRSMTIWL